MLRKRSRPVSSSNKQTTVCDHNINKNNFSSLNSEKSHKATSFLFNSPRIFKDFFSSKDSVAETSITSPSSVLDTKPFSSAMPTCPVHWAEKQFQNPKTFSSEKHSWEQPAIGLALIDDHREEKNPQLGPNNTSKSSKQRSKLVVFGSHLKIQIPPALSLPASPQSPMEFGIKTPKSNLLGHVFANSVQQKEDYGKEKKRLSVEDMESSEDYTCVISHGPNPKTTHIFGNCIVKSCRGAVSNTSSASASSARRTTPHVTAKRFFYQGNTDSYASENVSFLSFCHRCNKKIGQGKDIYIYRGEKAFCSQECRGQEMLFDGIEC